MADSFASARDIPLDANNISMSSAHYSPYAGRNYPTRVLWGDTHLHTCNSLDARAGGIALCPEQAYRFALGEERTSTWGKRPTLSRALDFLVVSDHSDGMGVPNEVVA